MPTTGGAVLTNARGEAVLNTDALDVVVGTYTVIRIEPEAVVAQKGDWLEFTMSRMLDLTFNPVPFEDGLNPFAFPKIREAMNRLIDRNYIVSSFIEGEAEPQLTVLYPGRYDYELMSAVLAELEARYSYDKQAAQEEIAQVMQAQGAVRGDDGYWYYNGEPVELLFVIRDDDPVRLEVGDYIADELESIGFTVERIYEDFANATSLCIESDPREGGWHLYTNAWDVNRFTIAS
jgi:peptide/nickel transport system substrate-binding protein